MTERPAPGASRGSFVTTPVRRAAVSALALAAAAGTAFADPPVILQWFEAKWTDIERRMPDFFLAGYGATWLPPASKASAGSAGYDVWDRFDLGSPTSQTAYGTEEYFRALIGEFHQANGLVYVDAVLNHNGARQTSIAFQAAGGYPGFWMASDTPIVAKQPTHNWGDFHNGISSGYYQSENPNGARYDLLRGDLVALVDIAQESNHQFIRQPVAAGNPQNIPAGTSVNLPDPSNARFYPDRNLPGVAVSNPGTFRNPGVNNFTFYPYNTETPLAGDPVTDNTTGLLMRWTQWMLDEHRVDGFRFDAIKHAPSWFWDTYIDAELYQRRVTPDGRRVTPYTFGECVEGNQFTYDNYVRKPNNVNRAGDSFGNRDCLDLNGSGQLRDLVAAGGVGSWQGPLNAHLDNQDGLNDGTLGVNHTFSHDNGVTGDGGSAPPNPTLRQMGLFANAYVFMRAGQAKLYHNARGITRSGGFWPRQGTTIALGVDPVSNTPNPMIPTLVQLHNWYGRGEFNVLNGTDTVNPSLSDVIVFERRKHLGGGAYSANVLVACNDSYSNGLQTRNVLTSFPAGTRLIEMTGNAADSTVDPSNQVPESLTVAADRRVLITIPNNRNSSGVEHNKGYVVYGPAVPSGTLSFTNVADTLAADGAGIPSARRRIAAVPVIRSDQFRIQLTTTNGDAGASNNDNADDNAVFRIDQGFRDFNGNGSTDIDHTNGVVPGYEQFVTQRIPLAGTANANGLYAQDIDASTLTEGFHYVSVVAFRRRSAGDDPLFRDFRQVVYIDRQPPAVDLVEDGQTITTTTFQFTARALDRTANKMYIVFDLPEGEDPVEYANAHPDTIANRRDRFEWFRTVTSGLTHGPHTVTVVAFEEGGNAGGTTFNVFVNRCPADFDQDGFLTGLDYDLFVGAFEAGEFSADYDGDGFITGLDFDLFVGDYEAGC